MTEPTRSRAVFSPEDFALLKTAVGHYMTLPEVIDSKESIKFSNLYHRLGRIAPPPRATP